jgi:cation-transporting ATPase E
MNADGVLGAGPQRAAQTPPLAVMEKERHALDGLTLDEVRSRTEAGLANRAPSDVSRSLWHILRGNLFTLFNGVVGGGFLLLLALGHWQDALFGVFVIANVLIGVVQEYRAKRSLEKLAVLHAPRARVRRAGVVSEIPVQEIVLDDILILRGGDQVTADARMVSSDELEIDESLLTGEADPVVKAVPDEVFSGSAVVSGNGAAQVCRVGADSVAGRMTAESRRFSLVNSELRNALNRVIAWISWALVPLTLLVVNGQMVALGGWATVLQTGLWRQGAVSAVASTVSMIPQGLVFITSVTFAVAAVKLARRQVLVQELPAVEGLARVDVVCLDKTGTLTEGEIVFDAVHDLSPAAPPAWRDILGWFGADENANATARCLRPAFPSPVGLSPDATVPFSSARKWSAAQFGTGDAGGSWVLGAPELVLDPRVAEDQAALRAAADLAHTGLRTLMLAHTPQPIPAALPEGAPLPPGLRAVVIVTLRERVRPDAERTLAYFREQGVGLRVLSGDNPRTVAAVAREVGLDFEGDGYDARELPEDPDELAAVLERNLVLGRVTPSQKRDIVLALQRHGHVVAMTGDGVNDALALKRADIGIAMGSGSDVTKGVSRLILLDNDFSHLPGVVAEGRRVIANVELVSKLFLTKTTYAVLLAIVFGGLLLQYPFLPRQLSAVDGLTIGIPALFLALLPNSRRYIPGFLRRALSFCIPAGLVLGAAIVFVAAYVRSLPGTAEQDTQTTAVIAMTLAGLWVVVVQTRPFGLVRVLVVVAMYVGLLFCLTLPLIRDFFRLSPPTADLLLVAVGAALPACVLIEIIFRVRRRADRKEIRDGGRPRR